MGGHHSRLSTDSDQNSPVAEGTNGDNEYVEGQEIPDSVGHLRCSAAPEALHVARAVQYPGRWESNCTADDDAADPRERHRRVYHPLAQYLLAPDRVYHLQIAFDGDCNKVDQGTELQTERSETAHDRHTQPVSRRPREIDVGQSGGVSREQEEAADEVENVLVEDQHVLLVFFRCNQRVHYHRISSRSK